MNQISSLTINKLSFNQQLEVFQFLERVELLNLLMRLSFNHNKKIRTNFSQHLPKTRVDDRKEWANNQATITERFLLVVKKTRSFDIRFKELGFA